MDVKRLRNPFFSRQRITDPACFYGRQRELEALYSAIAPTNAAPWSASASWARAPC